MLDGTAMASVNVIETLLASVYIAGQVVAGVLIADLISGVLHWFEDSYGNQEWPILGPYVIEPNIRHHRSPLDFARVSYLKRNRVVIIIAGFLGVLFYGFGWLNVTTITALVVGSQANEIHCWSHMPTGEIPSFLQKIQKTGLLLSPQHHRRHHRGDFDSHYCTVTDFTNPLLDHLKIFRGIERSVSSLLN